MDTKIKISFLKLNNTIKGIGHSQKPEDLEIDWIENRADAKTKESWNGYLNHYEKVGVTHSKVKYPVLFG